MARNQPAGRIAVLEQKSFGPFTHGSIDSTNALLDMSGALKKGSNLYVVGMNQVLLRAGSTALMTFQDDQGTPANVTSIRGIAPFKDRALVIAHSTVTSKVYGYIVASDFTGWYAANDTLTTGTTAAPTVVLWTSITAPPDVTVAEGLGIAFVAHANAADASGLNWPSYRIGFNIDTASTWTADTLQSNLDGNGSANIYFSGVIAFQQHLWGWGFGAGTTAATGYNPSRARFSNPIFGFNDASNVQRDFFDSIDDLDLGNRTGSAREKILAAAVAGPTLFFFGHETISRIQGDGRDSWQKTIADTTYGIVGPKAVVSTGDTVYYWTNRGPARLKGYVWYGQEGQPEPLWDGIAGAVSDAIAGGNPAGIVAGFARDLDQVQWFYQADSTAGLVQFAAYDIRRDIWLGPVSAVGVQVACASAVEPVFTTTSPPGPPSGAPTLNAADGVGATQGNINYNVADATAATEVSIQTHTGGTWTVIATVQANPGPTNSLTATGLMQSTGYDARVRHVKNGQFSSFATNTSPYFTTTAFTALAPTNLAITSFGP
ncbi:MAG TPA: hypothetical protein VJ826_00555, partial [Candidatus Polarisedimenticolaceae bacterium]|nr:hypothetical protein [Candidatus Polarisedimenticolaceae bacterium]